MIDLATVVDLPPAAVEAPRTAVHESLTETVTLGLGNTYAVPSYRPLYTLTADGTTRSIVGTDDLEQFRIEAVRVRRAHRARQHRCHVPHAPRGLPRRGQRDRGGRTRRVRRAADPGRAARDLPRDRRPVTHVRQRMPLPVQLRAGTGGRPRRPGPAGRRPAGPPLPGRPVAAADPADGPGQHGAVRDPDQQRDEPAVRGRSGAEHVRAGVGRRRRRPPGRRGGQPAPQAVRRPARPDPGGSDRGEARRRAPAAGAGRPDPGRRGHLRLRGRRDRADPGR